MRRFPAPFGSAIMRARSRPRRRRKGRGGAERARALWIHLAETLSRMFLLLSFFLSGPSSLLPPSLTPPSFLLVIHLTRFSFLCVCLPVVVVSSPLSLPPHSALAANPFPATQSGQASRWKGAINNCIRIYDVLYGRAALGRIRKEGRKERRRRRN